MSQGCIYSRTAWNEASFMIGLRPCDHRPVGVLVLVPLDEEEDRRTQRLPVCEEHLGMRGKPTAPHWYEPIGGDPC